MWDPGRTPLKDITSKLLKQIEKTYSKRPEPKGTLCTEEVESWGHSPVSSWEKARVNVNTLKIREEKCLLSVANSVKLSIETEEEAGQLAAAVP